MSTWGDVCIGDRLSIQGDTYQVKRVTYPATSWGEKPAGIFTLLTPNGSERTGRRALDLPVKILPTSPDEAVATARVTFGAVEIGERDAATGVWRCPKWMDGATLAYHMKFFHYGETVHDDTAAHLPHTHEGGE